MNNVTWMAACAVLMGAGAAWAQGVTLPPPQIVLQLSADSTVEVQQDLLSMTLNTTREAADAATVQAQLRTALDAALAEARKNAQPGQLDVRTGNFNLAPRYSRDGKMTGWRGTASLVLVGRDFPRITQAAAGVYTLRIANSGWGVRREQEA